MKFFNHLIAITNYCNSCCKFCYSIGKTNNKKQEIYITIPEGKKLIKIASKLGCKGITFTGGGEPTTRFNELIKLMRFVKSMSMQITLVTNTFYANSEKEAEKKTSTMISAGLNTIIFSFDYDHLFYIPFNNYINAIKATLNKKNLKVIISPVDRKSTKEKNTESLKKLTKTLNGRLKTSFLRKKINSLFDYEKEYISSKEKNITVLRLPVEYFGCAKSLKHEFDFKKNQKLVFDSTLCSKQIARGKLPIYTNYDKKTVALCYYLLESFKHKKIKFDKILNMPTYIFTEIPSIIAFLKLYLSIKILESKSGKKLLKEKYPHKCNLCLDMIKIIENKELTEPSKIQIFFFIITNMTSFLRRCLNELLFRSFF